MKETPRFYNCLKETENEIFSLLFQGVKKRKSNFHNLVLSTINLENKPEARTVILRGFSRDELTISIHSDKRSNKINDIKKNKNVILTFYDDQKKIQLRVRGFAAIEESKKESWDKLSLWSRRCYLTAESPGNKTLNPSSGFPDKFSYESPSKEESEKGLGNFCAIKVFIEQIEWLYLASQGHRRALFEIDRIDSKISVRSQWVVP